MVCSLQDTSAHSRWVVSSDQFAEIVNAIEPEISKQSDSD